jgi:hypothetical protein
MKTSKQPVRSHQWNRISSERESDVHANKISLLGCKQSCCNERQNQESNVLL